MKHTRTILQLSILSALGLSACQSTKPIQDIAQKPLDIPHSDTINAQATGTSQPKTASNKTQSAIQGWTMQGAMAVRHPQKSWTASFNWNQSGPSTYHIRLFGPLGSGTVLIDGQNGLIQYQDGPKKYASKNAGALLRQQTGVALPVSSLYYWARGIPAPGRVAAVQKGPGGAYATFVQSGYKVEYPEYIKVQGTVLPRQIKLTGQGAFIKVVIKNWRL